jgi:CBS domain containing-hemolysin-like protein
VFLLKTMAANFSILLLISLCLVISFCLSGMEAGVFALSRLRIRQQARAGRGSAQVLQRFLEHPENFLWTIVVGNTLANFAVFAWLFALLHGQFGLRRGWFAVAFLAAVFLFYVFSDLLPKMLFRTYPNRLSLALAQPFRLLHFVLRPLVAVVEACSRTILRWTGGRAFTGHLFGNREELRLAMQESAQVFSSEERAMIGRVLELPNSSVRQITRAMPETITVTAETPVSEVLALCRERRLARLPVWQTRAGRGRVAGLVTINDLLFATELDRQSPVSAWLKPALFLDEDLRLEQALARMQRGGQRLAVVLGRDGREVGIVSLEDILKTIFGEVRL